MKRILLSSLFALMFLSAGCATTGLNSATGFGAITMLKEGVTATSHTGGNKTGEACSMNILGIYSGGDSSIESAKRAGGINTVSVVDRKTTNILGIYGESCVIVKGN